MGSFRRPALVSLFAAALLAAGAAACSAVLGLDPPSLACSDGCPDTGGAPTTDDSGGSSGADAAPPSKPDGTVEAAVDATSPVDVVPDVPVDRGPSTGLRCGPAATAVFCAAPTPFCCQTVDATGAASYACSTGESACAGYSIECASDNDCDGSDVCCFYHSAIKCEPENTDSCDNVLVCDPSAPASDNQCNSGQTCSVAWVNDAGTLPYFGCN